MKPDNDQPNGGGRSGRALDTLARLFDDVAPDQVAALENELRESGAEPRQIAGRITGLATRLLKGDAVAIQRSPPSEPPSRSGTHRKRFAWAAVVIIAFAVGWLTGRGGTTPTKTPRHPGIEASDLSGGTVGDSGSSELIVSERAEIAEPSVPDNESGAGSQTAPIAQPEGEVEVVLGDSSWQLGEVEIAASESAGHAGVAAAGETWVLDRSNWKEADGLLPEVILERVKNGDYAYTVKPVGSEKFLELYPRKFWEAGAVNINKYDVDAATCGLKDLTTGEMPAFYFGFPFPEIDRSDGHAGCKIMWNVTAAGAMGEMQQLSLATDIFRGARDWSGAHIELMPYVGRSSGEIPNPENLRWTATSFAKAMEVDGASGLLKRINDWTTQDKIWSFVPATRRVRRVNSAILSDPIAGASAYLDDLNCFAGKIESFRWKVLGRGTILAPLVGTTAATLVPTDVASRYELEVAQILAAYQTPDSDRAPWALTEGLTMAPRPVWIIEGRPNDPYNNFGAIILYIDRDMYRAYWKLVYNRRGEYFYNAMCAYQWSVAPDGEFAAVTPVLFAGVEDATDQAAIARLRKRSFIDRGSPADRFTLRFLASRSD